MAKRYTFRLTRKTDWLEEVIESVQKKDQSDFIREMVIAGIQATAQATATCQTFDQPSSDNRQTFVPHLSAESQAVSTEEDDDLDAKLEGMYV